jgi:Sulfotransferase family
MSGALEARWVKLLDSGRWRRLLSSSTGSRVQSSRAFRSADLARRSTVTRYEAWRDRDRFSEVDTLVVFIGHVKSGGSLLGAMLDAHADALVSDEVDLLRYLQAGFRREQLFQLVARGSRREAMKGRVTARRLDPYSLAVAGASQGRAARPQVLGDVRSGPTTRRLGERLELLAQLDAVMAPTEPRYLHVVRNPFDPISAMVRRGQRSFANAIQDYTDQCERLLRIREALHPDRLLTVRYESFTGDPVAQLTEVCGFLGLAASSEYLAACAEVIQPDRAGERTSLDWSQESVTSVQHLIGSVPFLNGYAWA